MAAEEFKKLSPEQLQKLSKTINDAKALTNQQAEIIESVIAGEIDVGKLRIAYLNEYFDTYSKNLDIVARKHSALNDAFLILDKKIDDKYAKVTTKLTESSPEPEAAKSDNTSAENKKQSNHDTTENTGLVESLKTLVNQQAAVQMQNNQLTTSQTTALRELANIARKVGDGSSAIANVLTDILNAPTGMLQNYVGIAGSTESITPALTDMLNTTNGVLQSYVRTDDNGVTPPGQLSGGGGVESKEPTPPYSAIPVEKRKETDQVTVEDIDKTIGGIFDALRAGSLEATRSALIAKDANDSNSQALIKYEELSTWQLKREAEQVEELARKKEQVTNTLMDLEIARQNEAAVQVNRLYSLQLDRVHEVTEAELRAQNLINEINTEHDFSATAEAISLQDQKAAAEDMQKSIKQLEEQRLKYITAAELKERRKNNRALTAEERAKIIKDANDKYKLDEQNLNKLTKKRKEAEEKEARQKLAEENRKQITNAVTAPLSKENPLSERIKVLHNIGRDEETGERRFRDGLLVAVSALSDFAQKLEGQIDTIAGYKSVIDTRLQGSSNETRSGSYWDQLVRDMTSVGAINPYFKQEDFAKNIKELVNRGIAFDLEQRAFLMTIQEKIASTFNVADGTLLRLIRIQQEDSTAGRLGMEASLNAFLNNMYETTEYLTDVATSVRGSLEEMQALMDGAAATEVEYQVQKWLGSLYSVGMSQNAVTSISQALGQIASGQIEGLTGGGVGNLLIMAANEAQDLSITDILTNGLNASNTNKLMQAVVNYLAEIAESSKDNKVIQQQLASVYGIKASDLKAATNLASKDSVSAIYSNYKTYENMLNKLFTMAGSLGSRTSMAEMMTNVWDNGQYTLAGSVASSPAAYIIYKAASLLDDAVGGIDLPFVNVAGFGVDLNTTVSDLMRVASLSTGIFSSIGSILSGLSNSFSGQSMLNQLGISSGSGLTATPRGGESGGNIGAAGGTVSESGYYAGNSASSDIKDSTIQESKDSKKQLMVEAKEEEEANYINVLNTTVLKIYELLDDVANGKGHFRVKVEGYGLTRAGSSGSLGGVGALDSLGSQSSGSNGGGHGYSTSVGSFNTNSINGNLDFGGWTTVM
jgi:hypothetical protein